MKREQKNLSVVATVGVVSLALLGGTYFTYASAQTNPSDTNGRNSRQTPGGRNGVGGRGDTMGGMGGMYGGAMLAASGDYVYVMRGNNLIQLRASDLSVVKQQTLPAGSSLDGSGGTSGTGGAGSTGGSSGSGNNNPSSR